MPLKPRIPGYDSGSIRLSDGALIMTLRNFSRRRLRIRNVIVRELPRVLSINSMVPGARMRDPFGEPMAPWPNGGRIALDRDLLRGKRRTARVELAKLAQRRHILQAGGRDCEANDAPHGVSDAASCSPGFNASLFPATTLFLTADAVTPDAKVWNRRRKRFVRRDLTTRIYYQLGGRRVDLDKNGVDDAIDIAFLQGRDADRDGVLDAVQQGR
jgi:hypothetical protein